MSPDPYKEYKPPVTGGGKYLKINDGETVRLRFVGYPVVFSKSFPGSDIISTRYAWAVYNHDTEEATSFEQGVTFYNQIASLANDPEWGDTSKYIVKVTRSGSGTDTKYSVNPSPNKVALTKDQLEKMATINLTTLHKGAISLGDAAKGKTPEPVDNGMSANDFPSDDDAPGDIDLSNIPF